MQRYIARYVIAAILGMALAVPTPGLAATMTWNGLGVSGSSGVNLADSANWSTALPGVSDNAHIIFQRKQDADAALTNAPANAFSVMNLVISNLVSRPDQAAKIDAVTFRGAVTLSSNMVVGAIGGAENYSLGVFFSNTTSMLNGTFNGAQLGTTAGRTTTATLTFGGTTSIKSNLTFSGNTGFSVLNIGGTTTIGSNLTFTGGAGTNLLRITSPVTISNNFAIVGNAGGAASNLVTVTGDLTVRRDLSLSGGSSRNRLTLDASNVTASNIVVSGSGATPYLIIGAGRIVTVNNDFITDSLSLSTGTLRVGGAFTINTLNANKAGFQAQAGTITFNGGASRVSTVEVASVGTSGADNYLIGTFQVGDSGGAIGNVRLVDLVAGNNSTSPQQLLANNLRVFPGGTLDINGLSAAFQTGTNAGTVVGITTPGKGLEVLTQLDNTGTIVMGGGSVLGTGALRNSGTISGFGVIVPALNNSGTMNVSGGTMALTKAPTQSGRVNIASSGTLSVAESWANAGVLSLSLGRVTTSGNLTNLPSARIEGSGTISGNVLNRGTISPGFSVGALTINGDLTLESTSVLDIELAGLASFDKLTLSGSVALGGTLNVSLLSGYTPSIGDTFTIITTGSGASGLFASITPGYNVSIVGNDVVLEVIPEPNAATLAGCGILLLLMMGLRRR